MNTVMSRGDHVNLEVLEVLEVPGPQLRWFTGNCLIAKRCCHKNLEANRCFRAELLRGIDLVMMLHGESREMWSDPSEIS